MENNVGTQIINKMMALVSDFAVNLIFAIVIFVVGIFIIKLLGTKVVPKILKKTKITPEIHYFIISLFKLVCYIILVLGCINILGFQTASIIAVLAALAVAVGMSLQGSISNFAGGLMLLIFKPFKRGDYIIPSYDEKGEGYVLNVGLLYTFVKAVDNKTIMLPNGKLSDSIIINFDKEEKRQLRIEAGIPYTADLKEVKTILEKAMRTNEYVLADEEITTVVKDLHNNGILLQCRSWIMSKDYWPAYYKMQEIIVTTLKENNIEIPFNQMDVHIKSESEIVKKRNKSELKSDVDLKNE